MGRKKERPSFTLIRDTREKQGWELPADPDTGCLGTVEKGLPTGDYSLVGYETVFTIERKRNTGEWSQNIAQERFTRELERLAVMPHSYIILEFSPEDIEMFPANSGIPRSRWRYLRITPEYLWKRTLEIQAGYRIPVLFAGGQGPAVCLGLCKWIRTHVAQPLTPSLVVAADLEVARSGDSEDAETSYKNPKHNRRPRRTRRLSDSGGTGTG